MFVDNHLTPEAGYEVSNAIRGGGFDPGLKRQFYDPRYKNTKFVTINTGVQLDEPTGHYLPVYETVSLNELRGTTYEDQLVNNAVTLRKDEWIQIDRAVIRAARQRLRAWEDLRAANSVGGFDGYSKLILEHEMVSDPGVANVDMDGLTEGTNDYPLYNLQGTPLPITHCDFFMSDRRRAVGRNSGTPIDLTMVEACSRRVAEQVEETLIGNKTGMIFGSATYAVAGRVWGYTNHTDRVTKTDFTASASTTGTTFVTEVIDFIEDMYGDKQYGPFNLYLSTAYDKIVNDDYKANSDKTTRSRLLELDAINAVTRLDYLTGDVVLLVDTTGPQSPQAINGMDITTMQWESKGGMQANFKVMAIWAQRFRSDYNGNLGVGHGTTA